jgi:hypothetical protein
MKTVLLERRLPPGTAPGDSPLPERAICCATGLIEWRGSYITEDSQRAYLLARAPDLETVRIAARQCGADVRWRYEIHEHVLQPDLSPNMAFELFVSEHIETQNIPAIVQACAPGSTAVRIMTEVSGPSVLVLARTNCRMVKPLPGITIKSLQPLLPLEDHPNSLNHKDPCMSRIVVDRH